MREAPRLIALGLALAATAVCAADHSGVAPQARLHLQAARKAAGSDFTAGLLLCNAALPPDQQLPLPTLSRGPAPGSTPAVAPPPTRVFDNLYYLGVRSVTSWAVNTPAGIILIDTLDNGREVAATIEAGLRGFGLDPQQIRYVIVTHGHGDHYGGAKYLAEKYHAHVLMGDPDWELAKSPPDKPFFDPPPTRDITVRDGQQLTLGGETLTLVLTPGHTLGTVSVLIPVTDRGTAHLAALWGGTGFNFPHSVARFRMYAHSAERFRDLAVRAGADVPLSNHPDQDRAILKNEQLRARGPGGANPYVMGRDAVRRFLTTYAQCARTYAAQLASHE